MDTEDVLKETLEQLLKKLELEYTKITVNEEENENFLINVSSENPSQFIGYHGENIQAIQHLLKILAWKECKSNNFNILLDVDEYRKRQEDNVINLTTRKIEITRKTGRAQSLPAMSPYLRRRVHLHCMGSGFEDIETYSQDEGDRRHIVIKLKS